MCRTINLSETLANKIEYLSLVGDVSYTMDDFYDSVGLRRKYRTDFGTIALVKQAQEILEARDESKGT